MILYIGQQHPITVDKTVLGVWVVVLSVIMCSCYYFLDIILFHHDLHHDICDYQWEFFGQPLLSELHLRLAVKLQFCFSKCPTPWMFPPQDSLLEYWIEHVTFGLLYVMFTFPTRIFYRGVPGFAIDLVPRINHVPPACWSTFCKPSLKW